MKKFSILLLSLVTLPVYAQGLLSSLNNYQSSISPEATSTNGKPEVPEVKQTTISSSTSHKVCEENDQTSLPLAYVDSLITKKDGSLDYVYDSRMGSLSVTSPDMIGNCSSMLEWKLRQPDIEGQKAYAIEVTIKHGDSCTADGCTYKVAKVEKGVFQKYEEMTFKPTLKGFEECLQKSGVVVDGKVVPDAIYALPVAEKFSGLDKSGKLLFVSHGPASPLVKAKYGKFDPIDGCDYYEPAHKDIKKLLTYEDAERIRLDEEASKLKDCPINEYHKVADFIDKYENYASELSDVRDRLILESAKKAAVAIASGKYTDDDLKVLGDFDKYIVQPKIDLATALYDQLEKAPDTDSKKAIQTQLNQVLADIKALNQKPYFLEAHTVKLVKDGKFDEAKQLNSTKLMLGSFSNLGSRVQNQVITPQVARNNIITGMTAFNNYVAEQKENYEIKTGQSSGQAELYTQLAQRMRQNIQVRTQNYMTEIQSEYARVQQPNGYCFAYWRNTQNCIQDSMSRIQELQTAAQHYNQVDTERATEYDKKAKEYAAMEAEGKRYLASQNGQPDPGPEQRVDTTKPAARAAQVTPQQTVNPTNPFVQQNIFQQQRNPYNLGTYAQYSGQPQMGQMGMQPQMPQNFLGQQAYGAQFGIQGSIGYGNTGFMNPGYMPQQNPMMAMGNNIYNLGGYSQYGGQGQMPGQMQMPYGYQQQPMMGYQPYMQYGAYSMYGR